MVAGLELGAQLAAGVVEQGAGVVCAVEALGVDGTDDAAVVGAAVGSGAVRWDVLGVVEAADDDGAVGGGVDEVGQDFVSDARHEVDPLSFMLD